MLRTFAEQRVNVCYQREASDAGDYAQDFLTIFKVIGWDVQEGAPAENWNGETAGLSLVVAAPGSLPVGAEALRDALRIYGIEVATVCDPQCGVQAGFILAVGAGEHATWRGPRRVRRRGSREAGTGRLRRPG